MVSAQHTPGKPQAQAFAAKLNHFRSTLTAEEQQLFDQLGFVVGCDSHEVRNDRARKLLHPEAEPILGRIAMGLSDPARLQLLAALLRGERSVNDLSRLLNRTQPNISRHLRILRDQQLVRTRRDRNRVFYRIATENPGGQTATALLESLARLLPECEGR
jgi:DNA-binding transcriptional ArsR family regulator